MGIVPSEMRITPRLIPKNLVSTTAMAESKLAEMRFLVFNVITPFDESVKLNYTTGPNLKNSLNKKTLWKAQLKCDSWLTQSS